MPLVIAPPDYPSYRLLEASGDQTVVPVRDAPVKAIFLSTAVRE